MAQIIMMAREYKCKPSDIIELEDEYERYCFNEVAFLLYASALDKERNIKWNKIKWSDQHNKSGDDSCNKTFMKSLKGKG